MKKSSKLFVDYYENWIRIYKEGAVRNVIIKKYALTLSWLTNQIIVRLRENYPNLDFSKIDKALIDLDTEIESIYSTVF